MSINLQLIFTLGLIVSLLILLYRYKHQETLSAKPIYYGGGSNNDINNFEDRKIMCLSEQCTDCYQYLPNLWGMCPECGKKWKPYDNNQRK